MCYTINTAHIHPKKASSGGGGVRVGTPEPTSHFPHEEVEVTVGRDLLRQGSANGQGGGRIQDPGPGGPTLSSSAACLSLPGAQACPPLSKMWQETVNPGAKEFMKLSWLLARNPSAVASRLALACHTSFPRGRGLPPAMPSESAWEPVMAKKNQRWFSTHTKSQSPHYRSGGVSPSRMVHFFVESDVFLEEEKLVKTFCLSVCEGQCDLQRMVETLLSRTQVPSSEGARLPFRRRPSSSPRA